MTTKPNDVADELERRFAEARAIHGVGTGRFECIAALAIAALRAKPADKGRRPVAWISSSTGHLCDNEAYTRSDIGVKLAPWVPLFAHPPERQDDAVLKLLQEVQASMECHTCCRCEDCAALLAKLDAALASQSPSTDRSKAE